MRLRSMILSTAVAVVQLTPPVGAAPLDVRFAPPDVAPQQTCVPRPTDEVVAARWLDWDGKALPDRPIEEIRRDLRLLRESDVERWFDTNIRVMDRLYETDPNYSERDLVLDQIELYVAANRIEELQDLGVLDQLIAEGPGTSLRAQHLLSKLLLAGTGVPRDSEQGLKYLVSAGYGGNTAALFDLAEMTSAGETVPGWDIPPELAVTLAFGGLVGELDSAICDRMNRIGNAFRNGELVQKDMALAEQWYRLSADLGDFNAAWNVASMHMDSEVIVKNNDTMLTYLEQAADAGLPYAQSELGRIFETGALVAEDPEHARALYARAAGAGDLFALIRLTQLLGDIREPTAEDRTARRRNLERMIVLENPPVWAFVQRADDVLHDKGRWAGEAEARKLLQRAIEIDPIHPLVISRLARLSMNNLGDDQSFLDTVALLERSVRSNGSTGPIRQLHDAYLCRSPNAPEIARAEFWADAERMSANLTPDLPNEDFDAMLAASDPGLLAYVQTQSLGGRGTSLAIFVLMQERADNIAGDPELMNRLARSAGTAPTTEIAKMEIRLAGAAGPTPEVLDMLRRAVDDGERGARVYLLRALVMYGATAHSDEIRNIAEALAQTGNGTAMRQLAELDGGDAAAFDAVRVRFANVIEASGDFDAILLALEAMTDGPNASAYLERAQATMNCNLPSSLDMVVAANRLGRQADVETWLQIAAATADDVGWQLVALGDAHLSMSSAPDAPAQAIALYDRAGAAGYQIGILRLLSMRKDPRVEYALDDQNTADLFIELIGLADVGDIPAVLSRLESESEAVQELVAEVVDPRALYAAGADAGNPTAQLELARIIRRDTSAPDALSRYADLLTSAAEQGQPEAMMLLSQAYSYGIGVAPSLESSRNWLMRAAKAGNSEAAETVQLLTTGEPFE